MRCCRGTCCAMSGHDSGRVKCGRFRCGSNGRMASVSLGEQRGVFGRFLDMRPLQRGRRHMRFAGSGAFLRRRCCMDPVGSAVEAHPIGRVVDDRFVVGVMHDRHVDVRHRRVIGKRIADPAPAGKTYADIAEAVIDAAIEADVGPPIADVECVHSANEAPVTRRPKQADARWLRPGSRHPEIPGGRESPIAGSPQITRLRYRRLLVLRQRRRRFSGLHCDISIRRSGHGRWWRRRRRRWHIGSGGWWRRRCSHDAGAKQDRR